MRLVLPTLLLLRCETERRLSSTYLVVLALVLNVSHSTKTTPLPPPSRPLFWWCTITIVIKVTKHAKVRFVFLAFLD